MNVGLKSEVIVGQKRTRNGNDFASNNTTD